MKEKQKTKWGSIAVLLLSLTLLFAPVVASAQTLPCTPSNTSGQNSDLLTCVNSLYRYALVITSMAAMFMMIVAGYLYIFSGGSEKRVATAKSLISTSLLGMVVLVAGFLLLKQINPSILIIKSITPQQIGLKDWGNVGFDQPWGGGGAGGNLGYGNRPINIGQWKDLVNKYSQQYNLDPCILDTLIRKESKGDASAIGYDGGRSSGEAFNPNNPPKYGLDWSKSRGIGLMQWTIFPYNHEYGKWPDANTPARKMFGQWYTVADFLNPDLSAQLSARYMVALLSTYGGNLQSAFGGYNGSGAGGAYAADAMALYNTCKAAGG